LAGNRSLALPIREKIVRCEDLISLGDIFGVREFVLSEHRRQQLFMPGGAIDGSWPGVTSTSHRYSDSYFEENYYHSFCKLKRKLACTEDSSNILYSSSCIDEVSTSAALYRPLDAAHMLSQPEKKRFAYSSFV
jgi:hypothetical protein